MHPIRALTWVALMVAGASACGEADPAGEAAAAVVAAPAPGEIVLDARADGAALYGRLLPVPPDADPDRRLALRVAPVAIAPSLNGTTVLDARFVEGGGIAVLTEAHALAVHAAPDAAAAILDTEVEGPLSVAGTEIAYVRGEWPTLEVAWADARTGETRQLTHGLAPTWNPAIAGDGSVVFVSGATGGPELLRVDRSGAIGEIPATRFPASATAPRVIDGTLVFEDEAGAAWVDLASGRVERTVGGRAGLTFLPDGRVLDGRLGPLGEGLR